MFVSYRWRYPAASVENMVVSYFPYYETIVSDAFRFSRRHDSGLLPGLALEICFNWLAGISVYISVHQLQHHWQISQFSAHHEVSRKQYCELCRYTLHGSISTPCAGSLLGSITYLF